MIVEYQANIFLGVSLSVLDQSLKALADKHALVLFHICRDALINSNSPFMANKVGVAPWMTQDRALMKIKCLPKSFDLDQMNASIDDGRANVLSHMHAVGVENNISSTIDDDMTILAMIAHA